MNNGRLSRLRDSETFQTGAKYLIQDKAGGQPGFSVSILIFSKGKNESFLSSVTGLTQHGRFYFPTLTHFL